MNDSYTYAVGKRYMVSQSWCLCLLDGGDGTLSSSTWKFLSTHPLITFTVLLTLYMEFSIILVSFLMIRVDVSKTLSQGHRTCSTVNLKLTPYPKKNNHFFTLFVWVHSLSCNFCLSSFRHRCEPEKIPLKDVTDTRVFRDRSYLYVKEGKLSCFLSQIRCLTEPWNQYHKKVEIMSGWTLFPERVVSQNLVIFKQRGSIPSINCVPGLWFVQVLIVGFGNKEVFNSRGRVV